MTFVNLSFGLILLVTCLENLFTLWRSSRKRKKLLAQWGSIVPYEPTRIQKWRARLRTFCLCVAAVCFCIAAARPQWGFKMERRQHVGVNILFAIDTSKSMLATDVRPNRLELAKMSILELLKSIRGAHVGLIAFAGTAFLQCPSTNDIGAFKAALSVLDVNTIKRGGTNLSAAMGMSLELFDDQANHKQIILLTDGENLAGDVLKTAKKLASHGIVVHTVGIGTPNGSTISLPTGKGVGGGFLKDPSGKVVITKLDEKTLKSVAEITKGFYAPLGNAGDGLQVIYNLALKNLPKESFESLEKVPIERYGWFLGAALLFLALEPLLYSWKPLKRKGKRV